ncbi:hypothetical protein BDC45DRAFT_502963 [Circinella umbellata]|nr:hypothetical protein BDC45DRAFT_502963 [Circinella umbellata]
MWEPNEQLLLRASTRYRKNEGTLFVTPRRVAWQQHGNPHLNPSLLYGDMGTLSQTPDTSPKVLLKISVTSPKAKDYTFHFISPKALTEREAVKSQIAELLGRLRGSSASRGSTPITTPRTAPTPTSNLNTPGTATAASSPGVSTPSSVNSPAPTAATSSGTPGSPHSWRQEEFKARRHLLSTSSELFTLHKELVMQDKNVAEEEFWASPYVKRIRQKLNKEYVSKEGRQKGKSSKMVELMPGQQDGSDVKYTLTSQIIHNIFTEFPSVKRAYDTNVPDRVSEQHFWKRFLASEFFHRSRTGARSQMAPYDDIFDRCLQEEDEENSKAPSLSRMDKIKRAIDLTATEEDHIEGGNAPDFTMKPGGSAQVLPLIRRFNRHAMRVLETPPTKRKDPNATEDDDMEREIIISDLQNEKPPEKILLDIEDSRRYFESQSRENQDISVSVDGATHLLNDFKEDFQGWRPDLTKSVMEPKAANKACLTLTDFIKRKVQHDQKIAAAGKGKKNTWENSKIYVK